MSRRRPIQPKQGKEAWLWALAQQQQALLDIAAKVDDGDDSVSAIKLRADVAKLVMQALRDGPPEGAEVPADLTEAVSEYFGG